MNLYFILHVCGIHNSDLSEENTLLSVQNNTGNQVTRQLRLHYRRYRRVLSAAGAHAALNSDLGNTKGSLASTR